MKKVFVSVMSLVLALSMAACGGKSTDAIPGSDPRTWGSAEETTAAVSDDKDTLGGEDVQIPNPWQECSSLEEAGKLAGFSFTAPESVDGYTEKYIAAIENALAEVIFSKGDNDDASLYFRKGVGTEDISGDCNTYDTVEQQTIGGKTVTCKGNDGLIYNATWNDGTYSYAVMSNAGMSAEQLAACLMIVVCCWYAWKPREPQDQEQGMLAASQIETVDSLEALSQKTGLPLAELTGLPFAVEHTEYVSYWENVAEIQYFGSTDSLRYRKSKGTEDNSGDYNVYAQNTETEVSGNTVTLKGENGAYTLAIWTDGQYAYSVSVTARLSQEAFLALIENNF